MKYINYSLEQEYFYLTVHEVKIPCNLYYYAIEPNGLGEFETLLHALNLFIERFENLFIYEIIFFPVIFEDEYVGMIKITRISEVDLLLEYGFTSEIGGYSIYPSNSLIVNDYEIAKFEVEVSTVVSYNQLSENLNDCVQYLNTMVI